MIELAVATGIPMEVWARAGEQTIVTAIDLITQARVTPARRDGPQMSG